jgi:hypothetical protein
MPKWVRDNLSRSVPTAWAAIAPPTQKVLATLSKLGYRSYYVLRPEGYSPLYPANARGNLSFRCTYHYTTKGPT